MANDCYRHRKFLRLSTTARGLWAMGLAYCSDNLTDGYVDEEALALIAPDLFRTDSTRKVLEELVEAGLWVVDGDGWRVHDYDEMQTTRADVEQRRQRDRERKQGKPRSGPPPPKGSAQVPSGIHTESAGNPTGLRSDSSPKKKKEEKESSSSIDSSEDPQGSPAEDEELINEVITAAAAKLTADAPGVNNPPAYAKRMVSELDPLRGDVARWVGDWRDKSTGARLDAGRLVTLVCAKYRGENASGTLLGFERVAS